MKKKIIIVGKSGAGKSYKVLNMAIKNKGTTVVCNGVTSIESYKDAFPSLNSFITKDSQHSFSIENNNKYFIEGTFDIANNHHSPTFLSSIILGCDYGYIGNDKKTMAIFDDESWNGIKNKVETFWKLSHSKCQIVITCQDLESLLDINLDDNMKNDILKYWEIYHI